MSYATAKAMPASMIPVVDLDGLRDGSRLEEIAGHIHKACREIGFLYVSNHGIDASLIEQARSEALAFFRQDRAIKDEVSISPQHRGFLAPGGAKMSDDARPDLKESFVWGHELADGLEPQHRFEGHNRWPRSNPRLQELAEAYFDAAHAVAHDLLRAFAVGMNVQADTFLQGRDKPISRASFVYYPPQDANEGAEQFGVAPHTDFGVLTVLCQDLTGGLQVQGLDGEWVEAQPIDGTLVVNVGDLLERWTNGYYRSTPHRVINSSGRERLSIVLAYDPAFDTMIDPAVTQHLTGIPQSEAITCGDYLTWRFNKAFGHKA